MTTPQQIEIPPPSPDDVLYRADGDIEGEELTEQVTNGVLG